METSPDVVTAIRDVGVPAAILLLVLLRIEPKLDALKHAVEELTAAVQLHALTATRRAAADQAWGERE